MTASIAREREVHDLLPTCPEHVWALVRAAGADAAVAAARKGLSLVLAALQLATGHLTARPAPRRPGERLREALFGERDRERRAREQVGRPFPCPLCGRLEVAEERTLALLLALLEDRLHRAAFEAGYGLCLRHLARALAARAAAAYPGRAGRGRGGAPGRPAMGAGGAAAQVGLERPLRGGGHRDERVAARPAQVLRVVHGGWGAVTRAAMAPFSDGEVHFLWWFIQGSIMVPDTRWRLRRAWGLCDRHAWGALLGEAAYRHGYLHGPTKLYEDLMERAQRALEVAGPMAARRAARRLRETEPCLMCELDLQQADGGAARADLLAQGRDPRWLRDLAERTGGSWEPAACGTCLGWSSAVRCRLHFRREALAGRADLGGQRALVDTIVAHLRIYSRSFVWGHRDTETDADRAALISAVGWCSGWRGLQALVLEEAAGDGAPADRGASWDIRMEVEAR